MFFQTKMLALLGVMLVLLTACAGTQPASQPMNHAGDHGQMDNAPMDHSQMANDAVPFDAQFIDGMILHHAGAITMAEQVLTQSERAELLTLAEGIIRAQQTEIEQMQTWRAAWYPDLPITESDMAMGDMSISDDASLPFDQRFLTAMISHHQGALGMATSALEQAEHDEIKTLANAIIATQQAEITQMAAWLQEWFGVTAPQSSSSPSPYAAQWASPVRGLSQQEVDDLLAGRGMGFARMAELNHYPGPRHLLDLQSEIALSTEQVQQIKQHFATMQRAAQALGQQVVAAEAELSNAFATGTVTAAELTAQVTHLAGLYGELRAVHLQAHLQVTPLLTPAQRMRYNELRGYPLAGHSHYANH